MTTLYLIRHGLTDLVGHTMAGRMPGVHLNETGRREAERLAEALAHAPIQRIYSSPLERARETAAPLAAKLGLDVRISEALNEVDVGDWTGKTIKELEPVELWKQWNQFRSGLRIPNGETMLEVQARMMGALESVRRKLPDGAVALISHGDPLRATLAYLLGAPLDMLLRFEVGPASVSIVHLHDWGAQVRCINVRPGSE
jgi:probable phosphomutase (TIGR03848 family)